MKKSSAGFTVLELLVAFVIFITLIFALVSLTTITLDTWNYGEERKDTSDRALALLSIIEDDLRNLYTERQSVYIGNEGNPQYVLGAHVICDFDKNARQALRFVRVSDRDETQVKARPLARRAHPADMFANFYEVLYVLDADPKKNTLWRGVRYFDRMDNVGSFLTGTKIDPTQLRPLETGILHAEFRFWGQETTRWESSDPAPKSGNPVDSGLLWDSSRSLVPRFQYYQKRRDQEFPDFVYPEVIRVSLVLKSQAFTEQKILLTEDLNESAMTVRVSTTRDLPDAPGMVRIDGEWVEYRQKDGSSLTLSKRGLRGSAKAPHRLGTELEFGLTYVRTIYLPVRQEAVGR